MGPLGRILAKFIGFSLVLVAVGAAFWVAWPTEKSAAVLTWAGGVGSAALGIVLVLALRRRGLR